MIVCTRHSDANLQNKSLASLGDMRAGDAAVLERLAALAAAEDAAGARSFRERQASESKQLVRVTLCCDGTIAFFRSISHLSFFGSHLCLY